MFTFLTVGKWGGAHFGGQNESNMDDELMAIGGAKCDACFG